MSGVTLYIGVILIGVVAGFGISAWLQQTRLATKRREAEEHVAKAHS